MDDAAFTTSPAPNLDPGAMALDDTVGRAADALLRRQRRDGHWVFELEADATIPAEYILLRAYLGEPDAPELERKIGVYLRRIQGAHGGWPLYHAGAFDVSATVKAYFALKTIGDDPAAPHMTRAREALLAHGGAGACNVFTRILLALFGVISWRAVPETPVEIMLLPRWFPVHLSKISYWARTVIVPAGAAHPASPRPQPARDHHRRAVRASAGGASRPRPRRAPEGALGQPVLRPRRRAARRRAAVPEALAPEGHRKGPRLRRRAAERRGRPGRHLPGHGQCGDDVRRAGLRP
jgi:hypothetical protein